MSEVTIIGIDLAKRVFQLHGARKDGSVVFRKRLSRGQLLAFVAEQPRCVVAMEACATAHGWGRDFEETAQLPGVHFWPYRALLAASLGRGEDGCAGKSVLRVRTKSREACPPSAPTEQFGLIA